MLTQMGEETECLQKAGHSTVTVYYQCLRTVSLSLWLQIVKQNALLTECTQQKAVEYLQMMTGTVNCEFKLAAQSLQYLQR